ncbi:letm1 and EF-hand domain-containing protein 1, mitochondrial, partial [Bonamia ostreae]
MAEFLQKRLKEKAEKIQSQQGIDVPADFLVTLKRVHDGKHVSEDQLKRTSNLFKNEIALDHSRETLNRICGYMGMRATGSTEWLRNHMKSQFKELKQDDYKIAERGIEKMTTREMSEECCERGMAVYKLNRTDLHKYLSRWIYFSVHRDVPIPVLIYASCFTPAERIDSVAEAVKNSDETNVEKIEMISGIEDKSIKRVVETKRTEDLYKSDFVAEKEIE